MSDTPVAHAARSSRPFGETVDRCRELLAGEGFGVLTEIDIQATLERKLGVDRPPYVILGACHPPSAHRALSAMPEVGVLLPCNVTVSTEDDGVWVRAMNPQTVLGVLANPDLEEVGEEVGAALERVIAAID
jgi:uncharacterized protein (DUF302 family)